MRKSVCQRVPPDVMMKPPKIDIHNFRIKPQIRRICDQTVEMAFQFQEQLGSLTHCQAVKETYLGSI